MDRIAVRIVRGTSERAIDPLLEFLRDHVFEPVGFCVHVVQVEPERVGEIELEQAAMADDLERYPLPGFGSRAPR